MIAWWRTEKCNTHIIEKRIDNHGEEHTIRVDICSICKFPVRDVGGHPSCIKQSREQEVMASMEWKRKQAQKIEQEEREYANSRPKTKEELEREEFEAETARVQKAAQQEHRRRRLADIEAEAVHLRKILSEEDK